MPERPERPEDGVISLPLVPLRDIVVFPQTMVPFVVGRKPSLRAVDRALSGEKKLFLSTQRNATVDDPSAEEINSVGTPEVHEALHERNGRLLEEGLAAGDFHRPDPVGVRLRHHLVEFPRGAPVEGELGIAPHTTKVTPR